MTGSRDRAPRVPVPECAPEGTAAAGYYDDAYFAWQSSIGEFGGWANRAKFTPYVAPSHDVLDFGCGGGFLLKNLICGRRIGVEPNPAAAAVARRNGVEVYSSVAVVPSQSVDVVISNHALEHTPHPLQVLRDLHSKLRLGGRLVLFVPCDSASRRYRPDDPNHHLYSWSPMNLGNLLVQAGYSLIESVPYVHKWPPGYRTIAKLGGMFWFDLTCRIYGRLERSWFQVKAVAEKH